MTGHAVKPERLLTWLDVERALKMLTSLWTHLPPPISGVDCFASGMEIRHIPGAAAKVDEWLAHVFGRSYRADGRAVVLRIGNSSYPVDFIEDTQALTPPFGHPYPLWREVSYLSPTTDDVSLADEIPIDDRRTTQVLTDQHPRQFDGRPKLVSFHSFKGGVGRTSALMTFVSACMAENSPGPKKILVIDADLEAPGISFWLDDSNRPTVSFVQLLEALHYPPAGLDTSLIFFAEELRKTSLSLGGLQRELFVLPAALDLTTIEDMPVTPEHLARNPSNPWQLSEHLYALGKRLEADAVFIDLRAGLSELASPILFDPRIDHFFVTTVAPQSVVGLAEVLRRLYANNALFDAAIQEEARPTVVLNLLTKELRDSSHYEKALNSLGAAYPSKDELSQSVQWLEADFMSTLMSLGSLRDALETLPQSQRLYASAAEWARSLYAAQGPSDQAASLTNALQASPTSRQEKAKRLHDVCDYALFADSGHDSKILATEPLLNLGKHFANELPNALLIGAKGAGKTFTFRQIVRAGSWQSFLEKLGFDRVSADARIFPVLWPNNISDTPDGEIKTAQTRTTDAMGLDNSSLLGGSDVGKKLSAALRTPPEHWEDFWDQLITSQFGISQGSLSTLNDTLIKHSLRTILVFDGIEEAIPDAAEDVAGKAIEALLKVTNRLSELNNPHLGALVFVRLDYVQAAIRQNSGQWLHRFQPFRLHWNAENFLRLAYMLTSKAGLQASPLPPESLRLEELKSKLEDLWGKKLGGPSSKEAHSARWVYSALCDLNGNVQARDLVRFLKFAADEESKRTGQTWTDRVLAPESMRKAIPLCSVEKVTEAKAEIASLRRWSEQMRDKGIRNLHIPFSATQAGLDSSLLGALQDIGVIYEDVEGSNDDKRLFLPEIYRYGLGFGTSAVGRPRMQALLKKNIGVIPL